MPREFAPRRLPITREYPGYQFYALLEYKDMPAESCFCYAALCITDWLKKRVHDENFIPDEARKLPVRDSFQDIIIKDLANFQINMGFTANIVSLPNHGLWTLRLKEPDSKTEQREAIPGRFFTTNIGLHLLNKRQVELAIRIDVLDPEGAEEVDHAFRPAFVRYLFETKDLVISQVCPLLYDKAYSISTEQEWKDLRKVLDSSAAALPVILFTEELKLPDPRKFGFPSGSSFAPLRQMPDLSGFTKLPTIPTPVSSFPIDPDHFAYHAFGFALTASVSEKLHSQVEKRIHKSYEPGDVLFVEPKRFGGNVLIYDSHEKNAYDHIKLDSRIYSKNKSYSFGEALFDYDVRNLEHRELIRSIQDSTDLKAEEKLNRLNSIIADLQNENESRVRKIDELKAQNRIEFQKGEEAERLRFAHLTAEYEDKAAELRKALSRIDQLERENQDARSYRDAAESFRSMEALPESNEDVVQYFQSVFADRIVFTERGIKTAGKCKIKPAGLWYYLYYMATDLYELHHRHSMNVEDEFKVATGIEVAMGEGKQSRKNNDIMSSRTDTYQGKEVWAEPHIKPVPARAGAEHQRIYYCYDHELDRIIISHVGDHLRNQATLYRS